MYYLYVIRCSDNSLYCGQTNNLERRVREHDLGKSRSAKYVRSRGVFKLEYVETFRSLTEVLKKEREFKSWNKAKKETYITQKSTLK